MTHVLSKEQRAFAFDPTLAPALTIDPGETVTFETGDAAYSGSRTASQLRRSGWRTSTRSPGRSSCAARSRATRW